MSFNTYFIYDIIIDKVNDRIILQVSNIVGTFTAGEQVVDNFVAPTKWAIFDKLRASSGATADVEKIEYQSFELDTLKLENIVGVFNEDEIIIGATSGAKGVMGTLESSKGIMESIEQLDSYISPYVYDKFTTYTAAEVEATTNQEIISGAPITILNCNTIPDDWPAGEGYFILEYGVGNEEGPIKYLAKPNDNTLIVDPSHIFTKNHDSGVQVRLLSSNEATEPDTDGSDYAAYITGVAEARDLLAELIRQSVAAGIVVRFIIVFPEYKWACYSTNE